jgi:hypothetical protein
MARQIRIGPVLGFGIKLKFLTGFFAKLGIGDVFGDGA